MNVKFFTLDGKVNEDGSRTEFVSISGGHMDKDEVVREATNEDRRRYNSAYDTFKNPPAEPGAEVSTPAPVVPAPALLPPIDPAGKVS